MGTAFITNIGMEFDETPEEIAVKAKKSLIEKNYVFKNFNGELVLNREFVNYFKPFVSPNGLIACRKFIGENENNFLFFTKNKKWLCMENYIINSDNYILTYSDEYSFIQGALEEILQMGETDEDADSFRLVLTVSQYTVIKEIIRKKDRDGLISMLGMLEVKNKEKVAFELEKICGENSNIFSMVFFGDYKNNPANMEFLLYYPTDKYFWKIDVG